MIRNITLDDAAKICDIYNYYIEHTIVTFEEDLVDAENIKERINEVSRNNLPWLVFEENNTILGYAYAAKWRQRHSYRYSVEVTVYLAEIAQNKGIGTQLYQALFEQLRKLNIHIAIGGVTLPNPASVALHEKLGMKKVAHFEQVGYKFDQWLDVGYWQICFNK